MSLRRLLDAFAECFTAPTFEVFCALTVGVIAQTGRRTVCGMLTGAGLAQSWSHDRAHRFFSTARWSIDRIGLVVLDLVVEHLVDAGAEILLAVDDTAHRRRGKQVHGAGWIHDGSAPGRNKLAFGHRWVVVGIIVRVPVVTRPICLPVLCRRWKGKGSASTVDLACEMVAVIAGRLSGRRIHVVADAAYHAKVLKTLPEHVTWTTRLPRNATLHDRAPARTGKRGRPRLKGDRIGKPAQAAADAVWHLVEVDLITGTAQLVARYAARWAIEVTFFDTRQTLGVGQARNRTAQAVERTWAFGMYVYTIVVLWYVLHGHRHAIVVERRVQAPWYLSKTDPSFADMLTALRRTIIAARFLPVRPAQPTHAEIRQVQHAWALAAA